MSGSKANPWHAAQKECARAYTQGKQAQAKPTAAKGDGAHKEQTKAEKKREVDQQVKKEKTATKARHAQCAKDLKADCARVQTAIKKTEEPARKAQKAKVAAYERDTRKAMDDQATAHALAKVQARRRLNTKTAA